MGVILTLSFVDLLDMPMILFTVETCYQGSYYFKYAAHMAPNIMLWIYCNVLYVNNVMSNPRVALINGIIEAVSHDTHPGNKIGHLAQREIQCSNTNNFLSRVNMAKIHFKQISIDILQCIFCSKVFACRCMAVSCYIALSSPATKMYEHFVCHVV